ncbi:hypothetical protein B7486_14640 [cyanobacterium TDX16]|nr:hypothetical protein B7486_14640 [cyanobacterium TDX16]
MQSSILLNSPLRLCGEACVFERFSDEVRDVIGYANLAATSRGHQFMGPEHVLLGMLKEGKCPAAGVLNEVGAELESMEQEMDRLVRREVAGDVSVKLPMTPQMKKVIERSIEVAMRLRHNSVGTEHLLFALLENPDGVQVHMLTRRRHDVEAIRSRTLELLARYEDRAK